MKVTFAAATSPVQEQSSATTAQAKVGAEEPVIDEPVKSQFDWKKLGIVLGIAGAALVGLLIGRSIKKRSQGLPQQAVAQAKPQPQIPFRTNRQLVGYPRPVPVAQPHAIFYPAPPWNPFQVAARR